MTSAQQQGFEPIPDSLIEPQVQGKPWERFSLAKVGAVLRRRIAYCARFIYWTAKHRSTANVRWVLAYEGYSWN